MTNDFLSILRERGFVHQTTNDDEIAVLSKAGALNIYVGFDLTADGLHVGSLIQLMLLRWARATNTRVTVLLGGFTTRIGDPTGRKDARAPLDRATIDDNYQAIKLEIDDIVNDQDGEGNFANNASWLDDLSFADFLVDFAPMFSVNRMLAMDSVKNRLESDNGLTMMEFTYSLLQAIDFLELNTVEGCNLQIGGRDQWSNILSGVDLIRRKTSRQAYGLTTPLMTNAAGEKMGKTAGGAVWLSSQKTSPFEFWQFWRNVEDAKVQEFLGLFTELPMDEVRRLGALSGSEINEAKKILATEITRIVHGIDEADAACQTAAGAFEQGNFENIPITHLPSSIFDRPLSDMVAKACGCSRNEARRLVTGRAVKINGELFVEDHVLTSIMPIMTEPFRLDVGKKNVYRIAVQ